MRNLDSIAVYCGSSDRVDARWFAVAREAGTAIAAHELGLVYGGGRVGLMGAVADAALEAGGRVYGVIPEKLQKLEVGHTDLTRLEVVKGMSARKNRMIELSDAFVAMPGGFGTLEEIFEVITLTILNYHEKPVGLLNAHGFFDQLIRFLEHARHEGFIRPHQLETLCVAPTMPELLDALTHRELPRIGEWLESDD